MNAEELCRSCEVAMGATALTELDEQDGGGQQQQVGGDLCGICNIKVKGIDKALGCEVCTKWYHIGCGKISPQEYEMIQNLGSAVTWKCRQCKNKGNSLRGELRKIKDENMALRLENEALRKELNDRMAKIESRLDRLEETNKEGLEKVNYEGIIKNVTEKVFEVVREEEEKKKKINNLVLYGVQESAKEQSHEREEDDKEKCNVIFTHGVGMHGIAIEKTVRLGRRYAGEESQRQRPRPMLVKLRNKEDKFGILKNAKALARANEEMRKIVITPDRTKKEQEKDRELRNELRIKRESGETGWYIQGGQLKRANFREASREMEC